MEELLQAKDTDLATGLKIRSGRRYRITVKGRYALCVKIFDAGLSQTLGAEPVVVRLGSHSLNLVTRDDGTLRVGCVPPGEHRLSFAQRPGLPEIWVPAQLADAEALPVCLPLLLPTAA